MVEKMGDVTVELKRLELFFREEIELNNVLLGASVAYFFIVLFALLMQEVALEYGIILLLTALMLAWALVDKRKEIRRKYDDLFKVLEKRARNKKYKPPDSTLS
jgi:cell division protein FtsW (lipid II flippase)